jgi:acyl-CoA synthetase (AMP-forming)/AMP-acid ligase II
MAMHEISTLVELLEVRASEQSSDLAFVQLSDRGEEIASLTFGELGERARAFAHRLAAEAQAGDRVLLLFMPGIDFIVAFFACLRVGLVAVPIMVPRRTSIRDESASIVANCAPRLVLTHRELSTSPRGSVLQRFVDAGIELIAIDEPSSPAKWTAISAAPVATDLAFLQYTSGSTSAPKGVMVTHANLIANLELLHRAMETTPRSTFVSWLPVYHDMGLILTVLNAMYAGAACVLMPPVAFIHRPMVWLRAIQRYRAEITAAPNFAYDLCVDRFNADQARDLDLSSLRVAVNASEPVRHQTIERFTATFSPYGFDPRTAFPLYGLAEATVLATAAGRGAGPVFRTVSKAALQSNEIAEPASAEDREVLVSCGAAFMPLAVVDPDRGARLGTGQIGEVWLAGSSVCRGYWQNPEASAATFMATIAGEGQEPWLRTGDLGFVDTRGELFIIGRIKDVIIIRGMNHHPQDIETTIQATHPALSRNCGAAFAIIDDNGREAIAVVQEVERTSRNRIEIEEITALIREAVFQQHELALKHVLLAKPSALPKTTSGKIQRNLTRQLWQEGRLDLLG